MSKVVGCPHFLSYKATKDGKHGDTSVCHLGFAITLEGDYVGLFGESEGVEESHGGECTWHGVDGEGVERCGGAAGGGGGEGGG